MKEQFKEPEIKNTEVKYLREDIAPIMACVGTPEDFGESLSGFYGNKEIHNIDYYDAPTNLAEKGFKNKGDNSYVISSIDNKDKFSHKFYDCTGVVIVGKDKESGENVSFLSHQDPQYFLRNEENKKEFLTDLKERIEELKEKCVEKTIDARIVGGNYINFDFNHSSEEFLENYVESIKLLSSEIMDKFGFEPVVVMGPKIVSGSDYVYFDNKNRRLYIMRPEVGNATSISYEPKDIDTQKEKWE